MTFPVEGAVLDGFGHVFGGNFRHAVQVGDGSGDFQDTVVRPRAEPHLVDRQRHDLLRRVVQPAILLQLLGTHPGIEKDPGVFKPAQLHLPDRKIRDPGRTKL